MLIGMIIVATISVIAGAQIRIWAFTLFALCIALGFGVVAFERGQSALTAMVWALGYIVTMEAFYVASVVFCGYWRRAKTPSKAGSLADRARTRGE